MNNYDSEAKKKRLYKRIGTEETIVSTEPKPEKTNEEKRKILTQVRKKTKVDILFKTGRSKIIGVVILTVGKTEVTIAKKKIYLKDPIGEYPTWEEEVLLIAKIASIVPDNTSSVSETLLSQIEKDFDMEYVPREFKRTEKIFMNEASKCSTLPKLCTNPIALGRY